MKKRCVINCVTALDIVAFAKNRRHQAFCGKSILHLVLFCGLFVFLFVMISVAQVYAANGEHEIPEERIGVQFEDIEIYFEDQAPTIVDGRTLVPVRAVFAFLGFEVEWHDPTVTLTRGFDVIQIRIGEEEFITNGVTHTLAVPAQIIGGRTLLPIRALVESAGYYVGWNGVTRTVLISTEPLPEPPGLTQAEIPYRELTDYEINAWIYIYHAMGGALEIEREVIRITNIERINAGLSPVDEDPTLMLAARFKSQSMYDLDYFDHTSPVYGHFANIARQVFNFPLRSMGENLASGHITPEEVVQAWMNSASHRDNILTAEYTRIGVGFHNNRWAQKFSG